MTAACRDKARALGATPADLLPSSSPAEPLPVLREQAERLFADLLEKADRETFLRLNPYLALLVYRDALLSR